MLASGLENRRPSSAGAGLSHDELKSALYAHIRDSGALRSLRGQLRQQLVKSAAAAFSDAIPSAAASSSTTLRLGAVPPALAVAAAQAGSLQVAAAAASDGPSPAINAACESLIENFLRVRDLGASHTVFTGETGYASEAAAGTSDEELRALLQVPPAHGAAAAMPVLAALVHAQLRASSSSASHLPGFHRSVADVGVQCRMSGVVGGDDGDAGNAVVALAAAATDSVEYKLALVDQRFLHASQANERAARATTEQRLAELRQQLREECARDAKHELRVWRAAEEASIRRDERARVALQEQQAAAEFARRERRLQQDLAEARERGEAASRRVSLDLLRLHEERDDLKKAVALREAARSADERAAEQLRDRVRSAESRAVALEAQVEHLGRAMDAAKVSELRRLDLKERENADLLAQLHEMHERVAQARFEGRALADECAWSLETAQRATVVERARGAAAAAAAATATAQAPSAAAIVDAAAAVAAVQPVVAGKPASAARKATHTDPAARVARPSAAVAAAGATKPPATNPPAPAPAQSVARRAPGKPASASGRSPAASSSSSSSASPPRAKQPVAKPADTATVVVAAMPAPATAPVSEPVADAVGVSPVRPDDASVASAGADESFEASSEESSPVADATARRDAAAEAEAEASRLKAAAAAAESARAALAAVGSAEAAARTCVDDDHRVSLEVIIAAARDSHAAAVAAATARERAAAAAEAEAQEAAAAARLRLQQFFAGCVSDEGAAREATKVDEEQRWRGVMWEHGNAWRLLVARRATRDADEETVVRAVVPVLRRDSDSDEGEVNIMRRNSDDDEDF
jgi:hypothetical protein